MKQTKFRGVSTSRAEKLTRPPGSSPFPAQKGKYEYHHIRLKSQ